MGLGEAWNSYWQGNPSGNWRGFWNAVSGPQPATPAQPAPTPQNTPQPGNQLDLKYTTPNVATRDNWMLPENSKAVQAAKPYELPGLGFNVLDYLPQKVVQERLGYAPSFWSNPQTVVKYYKALKAAPQGFAPPPGFDPQMIEAAYKYLQYRNNNAPDTEWKWLAPNDPGLAVLGNMGQPSPEWLYPEDWKRINDPTSAQRGELNWNGLTPDARQQTLADPNFDIAKYPAWMRPEILADPNFDWSRLPKWQKWLYDLQSMPLIGPTVQGAVMGLPFGPAGVVRGGIIGLLAGASGYDPSKDFWEQGWNRDKKWTWDLPQALETGQDILRFGFGLIQLPVELEEKTFGLMKQIEGAYKEPDKFGKPEEILKNLGAAYQAGGVYYASFPSMLTGKDYILGRAEPIERPRVYQLLADARQRIIDGANPREVALEAQGYVGAQASWLILQMGTDPLNVLPHVQNKVLGKFAEITGHETAARAFYETHGPGEAWRQYKTLVQTGAVPETFRFDEMGAMSRFFAGVTKEGDIRAGPFSETGLFDPVKAQTPEGRWARFKSFIETQSTLTPESRARVGTGLFYDNIGAFLSRFDDPAEAVKYLRALGKSDMETWAQMGARFTNSPEWYTTLPALKDFNFEKLDGLMTEWDAPRAKRDMAVRIAQVLGENPSKWVEDIAKRGTFEQDYQRLTQRLGTMDTPEAKAMLEDIRAGRLTPDSLKDIAGTFTGEGALQLTAGEWKARVLHVLGDHFDEWAVKNFGLADQPEARSTFFRTAKLMKSAQSILLLGGSPGYALTNGLSSMVSRALTGNFGYETEGRTNAWLDRFGVNPARLEEGVGMGGEVSHARGHLPEEAINKAMRGRGALNSAQDLINKIGRGMPFNKLSRWFEYVEGKQGYMIAMRDFWSQSWRRGVGFSKLPTDLAAELRAINPKAESVIYAAIEAGMNQGEIERALTGRMTEIQSRALVNDVAQKLNMPANEAAHMLEKIGVFESLDQNLSKARTPEQVRAAFERARQVAQDRMDLQAVEDAKAQADYVRQRLNAEGPGSLLDLYSDVVDKKTDRWLDHYDMFDDAFAQLDAIDDPKVRSKVLDETYSRSNAEWRRVNNWEASTYKGVFDTLGIGESEQATKFLAALADTNTTMDEAYQFMRDSWRGYSEKYANDWENMLRYTERDNIKAGINKRFADAFARERNNLEVMGEQVARHFESQFGPAAGEAARQWWKDVVDFRQQMTDRLQQFRSQVEALPYDQRAAAKQEFYRKVYQPMIAEAGKIKLEGARRMQNVVSGRAEPQDAAALTQAALERAKQADAERQTKVQNAAEVTSKYGLPLANADGTLNAGNQIHSLAIVEKYAPDLRGKYKTIFDVPPNEIERAFANRQAIKNQQIPLPLGANEAERTAINAMADALAKDPNARLAATAESTLTPEPTAEANKASKAAVKGIEIDPKTEYVMDTHIAQLDAPTRDALTFEMWAMREAVANGEPGLRLFNEGRFSGTKPSTYPEWYGALKNNKENVLFALDAMIKGLDKPDQALYRNLKAIAVDALKNDPALLDKWEWAKAFGAEGDIAYKWESTVGQIGDEISKIGKVDELSLRALEGRLNDMIELMGRLPDEAGSIPTQRGMGSLQEFGTRVFDDISRKLESARDVNAIAEAQAKGQINLRLQEQHAQSVLTREAFHEKLLSEFNLPAEQADAVLAVTDARAEAWAKNSNANPDEWYKTRLQDVVRGGKGELNQEAFHGSPYKFDKFTLDHIGTGEGAQAYGWGLYFADSEKIGDWYRQKLSKKKFGIEDKGQLYKVQLPDENYLLWDKPLSEQPKIRNILREIQRDFFTGSESDLFWDGTGEGIYERIGSELGSAEDASRYLSEKGINGIQYLDAVSRRKGEGSYNYVIFDENTVQILETYYQSGTTSPKGAVSFAGDGRAIIHAFENADVSTAIHELGHVFRRDLSGADLATVEEWAGVKNGEWGRAHEEKFARAFEKYLADGKAPTPRLVRVFEQFKTWLMSIYKSITGSAIDITIPDNVREVFDRMLSTEPPKEKFQFDYNPAETQRLKAELLDGIDLNSIREKARAIRAAREQAAASEQSPVSSEGSNVLFQSDNLPFGSYEEAAQFTPHSQVMDDGWSKQVQPLLDAMRDEALKRLNEPAMEGDFKKLSPAGQAALKKYAGQVKNDMAGNKLTTIRWGEAQRDFAMLNYNRRFGADRYADLAYPYQFFFTRTLMNTGIRLIDKPAWFANYGRLQQFLNKYPNPNIPERLRGKIKIPAPWLPDWMGDSLYIDPWRMMFTPANFTRPLEQMQSDKNQQLIEAERLLQQWAADGTVSDAELQQAVATRSGSVWERAFSQAQINRKAEIANPFDFMNAFMGPAWYVTTPWKLATGQGKTITNLPITNTARAMQAVTAGTPFEPIGQFIGLFGKPEEWARDKLNLPKYGEYGDYYVKRQLANMVADNEISVQQAQTAMAEGQNNPDWKKAEERVQLEMAMRVPLASETYALLRGGLGAAAQNLPISLFGASILPAGELKYRGLKEKWDAAWDAYNRGDTQAVQKFFEDHPEYEAYLAKGKPPEEQLRSFLTGNIWDAYMSLDKANRKVVTAQMGPLFEQSFLNKETRSYDTIDTQTLAAWSRMLGAAVPKTPATQSVTEAPAYTFPQLEGIPAPITKSLNEYQQWKDTTYPGIDNIQNLYYSVPKAERRKIVMIYPQLQNYWADRRKYLSDHPEAAQFIDSRFANDILSGKRKPIGMDAAQAQRLLMYYRPSDFSAPVYTAEYYLRDASPVLMTQLQDYSVRGVPLGNGGMRELRMIWEQYGKPTDSLEMFLNDVLIPTLGK